jgi:hypothetical protein
MIFIRLKPPELSAMALAAHADVEKIRRWKNDHPDGIVISYVNTYVDVKAESDYCCASANAAKVRPRDYGGSAVGGESAAAHRAHAQHPLKQTLGGFKVPDSKLATNV